MATIREITELRLPSGTARSHWNGFVNEMIEAAEPDGRWMPFRWRRIERESDRDVVQFESAGSGTTRMTVELDEPGEQSDSPTVAVLRDSLHHDLDRFCESGECTLRRAA